jgi:hypothetical protein
MRNVVRHYDETLAEAHKGSSYYLVKQVQVSRSRPGILCHAKHDIIAHEGHTIESRVPKLT